MNRWGWFWLGTVVLCIAAVITEIAEYYYFFKMIGQTIALWTVYVILFLFGLEMLRKSRAMYHEGKGRESFETWLENKLDKPLPRR